MSRLIKPVSHAVSCNSPTLSAPTKNLRVVKEDGIASVYFQASRSLRASTISCRVLLISFRAPSCTSAQCGTIPPAFCEEAFFSLFIFISPSLGVLLPIASGSRSHLCHPCIVFTSRAAYIILTSVARGNRPILFHLFAELLLRLLHAFLHEIYRWRIFLRCNLNNYTTLAL